MGFKAHGSFKMTLLHEASIVLVKFAGAWNREEAEAVSWAREILSR